MSLEEFARIIMSIKPMLNNQDAFYKWMKNEEIALKELQIQKDINGGSTSQLVRLITFCLMLYYFP